MKGLKQDDTQSCAGFVACMATRTSIEEFRKFVKPKKPPYSDYDVYSYLLKHGFIVGIGFSNKEKDVLNRDDAMRVTFKLTDYPAYVVVDSINFPGSTHAIYWSGRRMYDPDPGVKRVGLPIDQYKIHSWFPIIKME